MRVPRPLVVVAASVTAMALFQTPTVAAESLRPPGGRTAIGDSVMAGAAPQLRHRGLSVDTAVSRQVADGLDVIGTKKRNGTLRRVVVVHLGTNGTFTGKQCRTMHRMVGLQRSLLLLTVKVPRSWEDTNNRVIRRCASRYSNVFLLDWRRYVRRHGGLLESDGYHLTPRGARRYATLVDHRSDRL